MSLRIEKKCFWQWHLWDACTIHAFLARLHVSSSFGAKRSRAKNAALPFTVKDGVREIWKVLFGNFADRCDLVHHYSLFRAPSEQPPVAETVRCELPTEESKD
jgi:hypothetical protein